MFGQARIDTLTGPQPFILQPFIVPGTLSIQAEDIRMDSTDYQFDSQFRRLWIPKITVSDTVLVYYRVWDLQLPSRFTAGLEVAPVLDSSITEFQPPLSPQPIPLSHSGSITRGVLAGNRRDATIESGLRLQMSGQLTPNIYLRAALTDENTPILPEGTTQRLSELDRVFIEIESPIGAAQLGDFALDLSRSTFAQLQRKLQGIGITAPIPHPALNGSVRAAAATSRGIFTSQNLQVSDGIQGPYRLRGNANEPFILVIPGSESVYLDGILLKRGESQDYVIDYATGDLTFTTRRLIRYHHRIVVEFQYRTTEFTRTLTAAEAMITTDSRASGPPLASLGVTLIREADGKSFEQEFGLTSTDRNILAELGDREASRSGATPVSYDPDAPWIHYTLRDTIVAGDRHRIYRPITESAEQEIFRVEFTRVGPGQGDYVRQGQSTNGIVYSYRGPGQGEYLPLRILPKPKQQRMIDLRGTLAPNRHIELLGEWAQSFRDENRFSSLDAADNLSNSHRLLMRIDEIPVGIGKTTFSLHRRYTGKNFASFARIRPVEFNRSWNLTPDRSLIQPHQETIHEASAVWQFSETSSFRSTVGQIRQVGKFQGDRTEIVLNIQESYFPQLNYTLIHIVSTSDSTDGTWTRHTANVGAPLLHDRLRVNTNLVSSQRHQRIPQGLRQDSRQYWEISPEMELRGGWGTLSGGFDWRDEHLWTKNYTLIPGRHAVTTRIHYETGSWKSFWSEGRVGLRYTDHTGFFQTSQGGTNQKSLLLYWNGRAQPWNRLLRIHWFYEALSEQSPVQQEIYIRTGPELGEYVWEDANENGLVEIDEFIPEVTQDEGEYVRTLIPSDSLQSVTGLKARLNLQFNGRQLRQTWLRQITFKTRVEIHEKSKDPDPANIYLLRQRHFRHPVHSIRGTLNVMHDLWLFQNHPHYGAHLSWRQIRANNVFAAATEMRSVDEYRIQVRWRPGKPWAFKSGGSFSGKVNRSSTFSSREFDVHTYSFIQEIQYATPSRVRLSVGFDYAQKHTGAGGRATIVKLPVQTSWDQPGRVSISGRMEFAHVMLREDRRSTGFAYFELTDGRGTGRSILWQLNGWLQLNSVLRATMSYSGRNPYQSPPIHTIRMQLSATF